MIKIGRNEVYFQNTFDSFCYLHEKSCKIFFAWLTVCVVALPIFNFGIFLQIPKKDLIMLANISLLKLCDKSKEKEKFDFLEFNFPDKQIWWRSFVECGCMPFDSVEISPGFSETFAKKKKKKKWLYIRKPLGKIPQETA